VLYNKIWKDRLNVIQQDVSSQLKQINFVINTFFSEVASDVMSLANNELVNTPGDSRFTNFLSANENMFVYHITDQEQKIIDLLNNYRKTHPYVNSVYMGRENGSFVRSHPREKPTKYDPRTRPWYELAKKNPDQVMKTDAYAALTTNDINLGVVKALLDKNGKFLGVLGADVTLANLTSYISSFATNPSGTIMLVDKKGMVMAGLAKNMLFKSLNDFSPELLDKISKTKQGFATVTIQDKKNYVVFMTSANQDWKIAVMIPSRNIEKEILSQILITLLGLLFGLILLSFLSILGLRLYIVSPLYKLIHETKYIAATSNLERRIDIQTHDEIGELAKSYNQMLDTISSTYKTLKKTQADLETHRDHLEILVEKRTYTLKELNEKLLIEIQERIQTLNELAIAKERAEAADRTKSAFLATMSHELRTPLNSIIGFTGIILQGIVGPLNEEQKKQLNMVRGSAQHLLALINDVLDISKIEAGQLKIVPQEFDLRVTLKKVVETSRPLAEKKKLVILYHINPTLDFITSDQRRTEQILLNLISNAIKFTEKGTITVECTEEDGQIMFSIADSGIGIKFEDVANLFVPFQQVDSGLTRKYEGTGLGLSICKKLIEQMGGKIWVESRWGKGSTFYFSLPKEGQMNEE
jgi:signal transduction histidine kinase